MSPKHSGRRARVFYTPLVEAQVEQLVEDRDEDAIHRLDRAIAVLSSDPRRYGSQLDELFWIYDDPDERVSVIFTVTLFGTIVQIALIRT